MGTPGYIISIYRDYNAGWQEVGVQPFTLKVAKTIADAIATETKDGPVVVTVRHSSHKDTLYVAAGGRLDDLFPRSTPT